MNVQRRDEPRLVDAATGRTSDALDRWEGEGGAGRDGTRSQCRDEPPSPAREAAEPQVPVPLTTDPGRVILTAGSTAHAVQVHHQDIPELNADGESPELAAVNLAQDLAREIEGVADDFRREAFQRALADIRAFIEGSTPSPAEHAVTCGEGNDHGRDW